MISNTAVGKLKKGGKVRHKRIYTLFLGVRCKQHQQQQH